MYINNIIFIFALLIISFFVFYLITQNIFFAVIIVLLFLLFFLWYFINLFICKSKKIPADSRLFRGVLEVHIGKKAKKNKHLFNILFIDSILWAKRNNIHKAVFFTWYSRKIIFENYFNDKVNVTEPNLFDKICNFYLNRSYWLHKTGKKPMKVEINVKALTSVELNKLEGRRNRLMKRINKI